jgi:hypothetical protein
MKNSFHNFASKVGCKQKNNWLTALTCLLAMLVLSSSYAWAVIATGHGPNEEVAIERAKRVALEGVISNSLSSAEYKKQYENLQRDLFNNLNEYVASSEVILSNKTESEFSVTLDVQVNSSQLNKYLKNKEGWITDTANGRIALFFNRPTRNHLAAKSKDARFAYFEFKNSMESDFGYEVIQNSSFGNNETAGRRSRRGSKKVKTMVLKDALDMTAEIGGEHAVFFDVMLSEEKRGSREIICLLNLAVYDTQNAEKLESYEIETTAEYSRRGKLQSRQEARLEAIQSAVDQAIDKTQSSLDQLVSSDKERVRGHRLVLNKFNKDEISEFMKQVEGVSGFSKSSILRQTARSYKVKVSIASNRNDFVKALNNILEEGTFEYSLNYSEGNIFITKFRSGLKKTE